MQIAVVISRLACILWSSTLVADEPTGRLRTERTQAVSAIFDEVILEDNFDAKLEATDTLLPSARYEMLADWVVPNDKSSSFRLPMRFYFPKVHGNKLTSATEATLLPLQAVVDLRSPAIELVRAASEAGQLAGLRERIVQAPAGDTKHERRRQTLLIVVDLAEGNTESAQVRCADILSRMKTLERTELGVHYPETIAVFSGLQRKETRDTCREIVSFLVDSVIRVDRIASNDPWDRGIAAFGGWAQMQSAETTAGSEASKQFQFHQWASVSRETLRSTATGFPSAHWVGTQGEVFNVTSHDEDYLYFQSPLRGDFEVECDVSTVQWQHSHLLVCGEWIAPVWGRSVVQVGSIQRLLQEVVIDPPLSALDGWIRFRTVIRGGTRSTYINGRLVQQQSLPENHDPWLAIRSPWYSEGGVKNLRITGNPEIPGTINLRAEPGLNQWIPGFDAIIGHDWDSLADASGDQIIGVRRQFEPGPTYRENVLRYHRPLLEDGTLEYEFLYQEGEIHVHPTLDGLVFLVSPEGVNLHRLTQGLYDRTETDPAHVMQYPDSRRGPDRIPLKNAEWNRLQLKLTGDTIHLSLNGELVFEKALAPAEQRRFGLFHYADQTQAVVRNIQWSGEWPRTLPSESEQELADPAQSNDELPGKQVFRHSFVEHGIPEPLFTTSGFLPDGSSAEPTPEGLQIRCRGQSGCILCYVSPKVQIEGDFDLTAEFARLKTVGEVNCSSGVFLAAVVNSTPMTEASIYRGLIHNQNEAPRQLALCQVSSLNSDGVRMAWSRPVSEESTSGRLRLRRRGKRIRSYVAEGDSSQFRLVSEEDISDSPLTADGIRLLSMSYESTGLTEVIWKNIEIHATKLTGPTVTEVVPDVAVLDDLRDQMPDSFIHDFATTPPDSNKFFRWRDTRPWDKAAGGLTITSAGAMQWLTSGFNVQRGISGDFDAKVFVSELDLAKPASGSVSGIYLVLPASDEFRSHATLHFRKLEDGRTVVVVGTGKVEDGEKSLATIRTLDFKSVSALRLIRHKATLTCLVSSPDFDKDQVIASVDFPEEPILPGGLQVHLHAGGAGLESKVLIPRIEIRGDEITGD